jgi:hypothetical protein
MKSWVNASIDGDNSRTGVFYGSQHLDAGRMCGSGAGMTGHNYLGGKFLDLIHDGTE